MRLKWLDNSRFGPGLFDWKVIPWWFCDWFWSGGGCCGGCSGTGRSVVDEGPCWDDLGGGLGHREVVS